MKKEDQREYALWHAIKQRCKRKGYKLDERFESFEYFLDWCHNQIGFNSLDVNGYQYQTETDMLSQSVKTYGPDTVLFVPNSVNQLCKPSRSKKGVQYQGEKLRPYRAYMGKHGKSIHLGYYLSEAEAIEVVKKARLDYIDELECMYKGCVDDRVWVMLRDERWVG